MAWESACKNKPGLGREKRRLARAGLLELPNWEPVERVSVPVTGHVVPIGSR